MICVKCSLRIGRLTPIGYAKKLRLIAPRRDWFSEF